MRGRLHRKAQRHRAASQLLDKSLDIVGLIGTQRDPSRIVAAMTSDQRQRLIAFRGADRRVDAAQYCKSIAVFPSRYADVAELHLLAVALLVQAS